MLEIKEKLNFNTINEAAYASESDLAYNLLDYLKDEYKLKKQSIEYRAKDIIETIRKSIKTDSPIPIKATNNDNKKSNNQKYEYAHDWYCSAVRCGRSGAQHPCFHF